MTVLANSVDSFDTSATSGNKTMSFDINAVNFVKSLISGLTNKAQKWFSTQDYAMYLHCQNTLLSMFQNG